MYPRMIVALMFAAFAVAVFAQAPAPSTDCSSVLVSLTPCLNFVMTGSKEAKPSSACCSSLSSAVASNAVCLCQALNSNAAAGLGVNQTKAGTLPTACNIKANIGQCKTITSPSPKSSSSSPSPKSSSSSPSPKSSSSSPSPKSSSSSASPPVSAPTTAKAPAHAAASPNKAKSDVPFFRLDKISWIIPRLWKYSASTLMLRIKCYAMALFKLIILTVAPDWSFYIMNQRYTCNVYARLF